MKRRLSCQHTIYLFLGRRIKLVFRLSPPEFSASVRARRPSLQGQGSIASRSKHLDLARVGANIVRVWYPNRSKAFRCAKEFQPAFSFQPEFRNGNGRSPKRRPRFRAAQSGAQARAIQMLARSLVGTGQREAPGLRTIYRRCFPPTSHPVRRQNPVRGFAKLRFSGSGNRSG